MLRSSSEEERIRVLVRNGSDLPVTKVVASIVDARIAEEGVPSPELAEDYRVLLDVAPPQDTRETIIPSPGGAMGFRPGVQMGFTDAAGVNWIRHSNGLLYERPDPLWRELNIEFNWSWTGVLVEDVDERARAADEARASELEERSLQSSIEAIRTWQHRPGAGPLPTGWEIAARYLHDRIEIDRQFVRGLVGDRMRVAQSAIWRMVERNGEDTTSLVFKNALQLIEDANGQMIAALRSQDPPPWRWPDQAEGLNLNALQTDLVADVDADDE